MWESGFIFYFFCMLRFLMSVATSTFKSDTPPTLPLKIVWIRACTIMKSAKGLYGAKWTESSTQRAGNQCSLGIFYGWVSKSAEGFRSLHVEHKLPKKSDTINFPLQAINNRQRSSDHCVFYKKYRGSPITEIFH